jgi:hypothetical protein
MITSWLNNCIISTYYSSLDSAGLWGTRRLDVHLVSFVVLVIQHFLSLCLKLVVTCPYAFSITSI